MDKGFFPDDEINYYPSIKKMRDAMSFMDRARKRNFCKILSKYVNVNKIIEIEVMFVSMLSWALASLCSLETFSQCIPILCL